MTDEIKVYVIAMGNQPNYQMQWKCPFDGKKKTRTTNVPNDGKSKSRRAAEKVAADKEAELKDNYTAATERITWENARKRYEDEACSGMAETTQIKVGNVLDAVERILVPGRMDAVSEERVSYFTGKLRGEAKSESSIKSTLAHLKAFINWCARMKMIRKAPFIAIPGRVADTSRGRPITTEEFERIEANVAKVVPAVNVADWQHFLKGLRLSGMRLSEALCLSWDDRPDVIRVILDGKRPMLWIPASLQKNNKNALHPITPDFAAFLLATPEAKRRGRVFRVAFRSFDYSPKQVGRVISRIGKKAGVIVIPATDDKPASYATAHDYRRSFGEKWSEIVMPQQLQQLMRHADVQTAMTFYVGKNAERTADAVWAAYEASQAKSLAKSGEKAPAAEPSKS